MPIFGWHDPITDHGEYWNAPNAEDLKAHLADDLLETESIWNLEIFLVAEEFSRTHKPIPGSGETLWDLGQEAGRLEYLADAERRQ